ELLRLSERLDSLGDYLKSKIKSNNPNFTEGLVTSSVLVCVGAMAIVGSFEEGLGQGRVTVYTKTLIDFFSVAVLASRLGSGVLLSSVPLLIYQGLLTMAAGALQPVLAGPITDCLSATGGLMVMGIGVNMIGLKPPIPISSILPALVLALIVPAFVP
ncbi:MAG: DUF554 domain-containing protein, partial [Deltaproteobacteria bacterium]|nr:DUF554 domain-containing protein [Deltaproteobacteria bacterium]